MAWWGAGTSRGNPFSSRATPTSQPPTQGKARSTMFSLQAFYSNFKTDYGDLLEVPDFSIPTWLAFGAGLQLLSLRWLPSDLSYWLPLLYLLFRVARVSVDCQRVFTGTFTNVISGRWTAALPEPEDSSIVTATSDGVVMFLLGARINQSVSLFLPRMRPWEKWQLFNIMQSFGQACTRQCRNR